MAHLTFIQIVLFQIDDYFELVAPFFLLLEVHFFVLHAMNALPLELYQLESTHCQCLGPY